jgi:hypothetical protein
LTDWLRLYGRDAGFTPDGEQSGWNERLDFGLFVMRKGIAFEAGSFDVLRSRTKVVTVAREPADAYSSPKARETADALAAGVPIIAQAVLRNPAGRTYGVADLLIRSDLLFDWFPELLSPDDAFVGATEFGNPNFHYRAVDNRIDCQAMAEVVTWLRTNR